MLLVSISSPSRPCLLVLPLLPVSINPSRHVTLIRLFVISASVCPPCIRSSCQSSVIRFSSYFCSQRMESYPCCFKPVLSPRVPSFFTPLCMYQPEFVILSLVLYFQYNYSRYRVFQICFLWMCLLHSFIMLTDFFSTVFTNLTSPPPLPPLT